MLTGSLFGFIVEEHQRMNPKQWKVTYVAVLTVAKIIEKRFM